MSGKFHSLPWAGSPQVFMGMSPKRTFYSQIITVMFEWELSNGLLCLNAWSTVSITF